MKRLLAACSILLLTPVAAAPQNPTEGPGIADLGFLIGTWKVTAVHFDVTDPKAPGRSETGTKVCRWTLESGGEPSFIVCENDSVYEGSQREAYIEYINYNPHVGAFEKTNLFSGFPVKVIERVTFDPESRVVEIRGRVEIDNKVDSYVESWRFDEGYTAFDREALINLSSMPMTEYRRIVAGREVRAED